MEKEKKYATWKEMALIIYIVTIFVLGSFFGAYLSPREEDCPDLICPDCICPECPSFNEKRYPEDDIELNHTPTGWEIFWYNKSIGTYNLREFTNSTDITDWLYDLGMWSDTSFPSEDYPLSRYQKETVLIWIMMIGYHEQTGIWLVD